MPARDVHVCGNGNAVEFLWDIILHRVTVPLLIFMGQCPTIILWDTVLHRVSSLIFVGYCPTLSINLVFVGYCLP